MSKLLFCTVTSKLCTMALFAFAKCHCQVWAYKHLRQFHMLYRVAEQMLEAFVVRLEALSLSTAAL